MLTEMFFGRLQLSYLVFLISSKFLLCRSLVLLSNLKPGEIAILQYDSRPLADYWLASALLNKRYCDKHNHIFIFYSAVECHYDATTQLASPWCKVKAMKQAYVDYPGVKLFIYMDSDAIVDVKFSNYAVNDMLVVMQQTLMWDPEVKPMVFNQDGPCWWCQLITRVGYTMCLNAGTVLWYRHVESEKVLDDWWHSAMDSYATNPIKRKFRIKWPWEQDRQMAVYNRTPEHIQIASDPNSDKLILKKGEWCLSHLPGNGCFISHYCSHKGSKQALVRLYKESKSEDRSMDLNVLSHRYQSSLFGSIEGNSTHPYGFKVNILKS